MTSPFFLINFIVLTYFFTIIVFYSMAGSQLKRISTWKNMALISSNILWKKLLFFLAIYPHSPLARVSYKFFLNIQFRSLVFFYHKLKKKKLFELTIGNNFQLILLSFSLHTKHFIFRIENKQINK